jgi:uncharacterized iron-regulated membrane protein
MPLAELIERAEATDTHAALRWLQPFTDDTAVFFMQARDQANGSHAEHANGFYVAIDPWSGQVLERFDVGGAPGFLPKVMPFVYELHKTLYLGEFGIWLLSIIALLWTFDCFGGFLITLPFAMARFWSRWKPAWWVQWRRGSYRVQFDLHRASGLWFWLILFVLAWSSVFLEPKTGVYQPVMNTLFGGQHPPTPASTAPIRTGAPTMDWRTAEAYGHQLLSDRARQNGYSAGTSQALSYVPPMHAYWYRAHTDRFFPNDKLEAVFFDADDGSVLKIDSLDSGNLDDWLTGWFVALHMINDPVDYLAYRVFLCFVGLILMLLSYTGVYIWWKKRRGRIAI